MNVKAIDKEFKKVMIPAILMGVITNIYIAGVVFFIGELDIIISPILSTILFISLFFLLRSNKISSKLSFLLVAYIVILEVYIHSYYLGWGMGFYYYLFLLPILFISCSSWDRKVAIYSNLSFVISITGLWFFLQNVTAISSISKEIESIINTLNLSGTAFISLVIMIYFSRAINKKDKLLTKVNEDLELQNKKIVTQHKNLEILLKEIHHRVRNNLQIISSLMSLERNRIENKEVVKILNKSRRRVEAIALIHQKLYQDEMFNRVNFKAYLEELVGIQQEMNSNVKCDVNSEEIVLNLDTAVPFGLIISELITNSFKHAFDGIEKPTLNVLFSTVGNTFELIVRDNGVGLSEEFDLNQEGSLGLEIIMVLSDQIGAQITCFNNDDCGACFKICLEKE